MNKNTLIGILAALAVGCVAGYAVAGYQYSAQLNKVKMMFPPVAMTFVSGTIRNISGNTLTLETSSSANPFVTTPTTREVTVTGSTKILKSVPKDSAVFQQEMAAYQKALQKTATSSPTATPPAPPTPVTQTTLALSDLKADMMVMVDAGKDVSGATSFDAVTITVTGVSVPPPSAGSAGTAGTAPIVNTPPPRSDGGTPPIVNTPPPVKK